MSAASFFTSAVLAPLAASFAHIDGPPVMRIIICANMTSAALRRMVAVAPAELRYCGEPRPRLRDGTASASAASRAVV